MNCVYFVCEDRGDREFCAGVFATRTMAEAFAAELGPTFEVSGRRPDDPSYREPEPNGPAVRT